MKRRLCLFSSPRHQLHHPPRRQSSTLTPPTSDHACPIQSSSPPSIAGPPSVLDPATEPSFVPAPHGLHTLRRRADGSLLPIPPLLDPLVDARRRRHEGPKAQQAQLEPSEQQRALAANPWAQMLLSPIRRDALTNALLPRFFLQAFGTTFRAASPTSQAVMRAPRGAATAATTAPDALRPHLVPVRQAAKGGAQGPRTYALSGQRLAMLAVRQRAAGLVSARHEPRFGVRRERWMFDLPAVMEGAEGMVGGDVAREMGRLDGRGWLRVCDWEGGGEGTVVVVLDAVRAGKVGGEGMAEGPGYRFVLPPRGPEALVALKAKKARKRTADAAQNEGTEVLLAERTEHQQGVLASRPIAVSFDLDTNTQAAVQALVRMDLFYRTSERSGREEILRLWDAGKADTGQVGSTDLEGAEANAQDGEVAEELGGKGEDIPEDDAADKGKR